MKLAALAAALLLGVPPAVAAPCPIKGQTPMLVARLYMGENLPGRKRLGGTQWRDFLAREVTPRFPNGFTVYDARGQWRDPNTGAIGGEDSKVLEVAVPDSTAARRNIQDVAWRYRSLFGQKSVGIVTSRACGRF